MQPNTYTPPKLYTLKLHETMEINAGAGEIMRVPGGWLYSFGQKTPHWTTTFVPYNNDFDRSLNYTK
jgi:hypothetical protein